jgi:hypothetical protein
MCSHFVDAKLEEFAVHTRCAPERVGKAHRTDQADELPAAPWACPRELAISKDDSIAMLPALASPTRFARGTGLDKAAVPNAAVDPKVAATPKSVFQVHGV